MPRPVKRKLNYRLSLMILSTSISMLACLVFCALSLCQELSPDSDAKTQSPVLAFTGSQSITAADIDFFLGRRATTPLPQLSFLMQQRAIHLLALQRQALITLRRIQPAPSPVELDRWLSQSGWYSQQGRNEDIEVGVNVDPKAVDSTAVQTADVGTTKSRLPSWDGLAADTHIEVDKLQDFAAFRGAWQHYLAQHLTQGNLSKHFENQKMRFDGTRFQIDLISVQTPAGQSPQRSRIDELIGKRREQLVGRPADWTASLDTPDSQSVAISRGTWVRGHGTLDPAMISPLLEAQIGDISQVHTASGVHLIRLVAKETGSLPLGEVRDEVRAHMLLFLLEHLANQSQNQLPLRSNQ